MSDDCSTESVGNEPKDKRETTLKPGLEDLGFVYTYRNEDIVNLRSMIREEGKQCVNLKENVKNSHPKKQKYQMHWNKGEHRNRRRLHGKECNMLLEVLMGMKQYELNKLLSCTPHH